MSASLWGNWQGEIQHCREPLHGVGLSIVGGAITTMGAGAPQFACVILFFRLNGTFIFLTSGFALAFTFGFLLPLLMAIGPEGQQGELCALFGKRAQGGKPAQGGVIGDGPLDA